MSEATAIEFQAPSGETLSVEWEAARLAELDPATSSRAPLWRLEGALDWDLVEAVRIVSGRLADGRLIAIAALRPVGARGHGEELVSGLLGNAEGFEQVDETLVSTEYGPDGNPRRVGIELYSTADAIALRIAADVRAISSSNGNGVQRRSATLELRSAGASGAGVLDLLSRP